MYLKIRRKFSRSRHLAQPEWPIFNHSFVIDNSSERFGKFFKVNHLSYLYAPWDAESLRHVDDVELFMSAFFGAVSTLDSLFYTSSCLLPLLAVGNLRVQLYILFTVFPNSSGHIITGRAVPDLLKDIQKCFTKPREYTFLLFKPTIVLN